MKWENRGQQWSEYDNEGSYLLSTKYEKGFFPFYVEEIVKIIVKEISDPEKGLTIHFEGTSDEYHELEAVCSKYLNIKGLRVKRSKKRLENARDILPDVNILFKEMTPVIEKALIGNKDYISLLTVFICKQWLIMLVQMFIHQISLGKRNVNLPSWRKKNSDIWKK